MDEFNLGHICMKALLKRHRGRDWNLDYMKALVEFLIEVGLASTRFRLI